MTEWKKSSYSGYNGNCVEVAALPSPDSYTVGVRDSKDPGPVLAFSPAEWVAFLDAVRAGVIPTRAPGRSGAPPAELGEPPRRGPTFGSAI